MQLNNYLTVNGLRERFQSAYKAPHNTETAPLMIKNDILLSPDRGNNVFLMFLDLLAAFHMVNHSLLLNFASGELVWHHGDCSAVVSFLSVSPIAVCKFRRIEPVLSDLHWPPLNYRIVFKILLLFFKSLNNLSPSYLAD